MARIHSVTSVPVAARFEAQYWNVKDKYILLRDASRGKIYHITMQPEDDIHAFLRFSAEEWEGWLAKHGGVL